MARKQKRRRKKMSISSAVIRFLIGLLLIAIVVFAGFYLLFEVDYSAQLMNSDGTYASTRAYVLPPDGGAATIAPSIAPTATPTEQPTATPEPAETGATTAEEPTDVEPIAVEATAVEATAADDVPEATSIPEPTEPAIRISTLEPTPSPIPTPGITAAPTPTIVPTTEPVGARIPDSAISIYKENLRLPKVYEGGDAEVGLSRCYLSKLNYYQVMQVNGWGYIDDAEFDGHQCTTFALITNQQTGKSRVYLCTSLSGVSGRAHQPQYATEVSDSDFQVTIDTSEFESGEYEFQIILHYNVNEQAKTWICPFDTARTFSVVDGEIVEGLPLDN